MPRRYKLRRLWKWILGKGRLKTKRRVCWEMIVWSVTRIKIRTPSPPLIVSKYYHDLEREAAEKTYAKWKKREKRLINIAHHYSPFLPTCWHKGVLILDWKEASPEQIFDEFTEKTRT